MSNAVERWETIIKTLEAADLDNLAAYVRDESKAAHAAPVEYPCHWRNRIGKERAGCSHLWRGASNFSPRCPRIHGTPGRSQVRANQLPRRGTWR